MDKMVIVSIYVYRVGRRSIFQGLYTKQYSEVHRINNGQVASATAMDEYRPIGWVFCAGSCPRSRSNSIGPDIPAGSHPWLVVYTDQVPAGTDSISWYSEYVLSSDSHGVRINI